MNASILVPLIVGCCMLLGGAALAAGVVGGCVSRPIRWRWPLLGLTVAGLLNGWWIAIGAMIAFRLFVIGGDT